MFVHVKHDVEQFFSKFLWEDDMNFFLNTLYLNISKKIKILEMYKNVQNLSYAKRFYKRMKFKLLLFKG